MGNSAQWRSWPFEENSRLLANPLASPEGIEDLDGWTLHRLRHSALTHDVEGGTSTRCCWPAPGTPPSAPSVRPPWR